MSRIMEMQRVECFSAAHRLHSPQLSDEENRKIFGKCNNLNGHGHNYTWKVILKGGVDPVSGMVFDLAELKKAMAEVMDLVDHKNLDKDVVHFHDTVSTSENVCMYLWHELKSRLSRPELLYKCILEETNKNIFSYKG